MQRTKAVHAKKEKGNDYLVGEEKQRVLEENRERVARVYAGLYAKADEAQYLKKLTDEQQSLWLVSREVDMPDPGIHDVKRLMPPKSLPPSEPPPKPKEAWTHVP